MNKKERAESLKRSFGIIYRQGRAMENYRVQHFKISGAQSGYLMTIYEHPGISQDAIAKMSCVDKGSVARAVKKLEDSGYLTRKRNEKDSRAWSLELTEKGKELCSFKFKGSQKFEETLLKGLSDEEAETLSVLLEKVANNIDSMYCEMKHERRQKD